jgi:propionate CoA-transferase
MQTSRKAAEALSRRDAGPVQMAEVPPGAPVASAHNNTTPETAMTDPAPTADPSAALPRQRVTALRREGKVTSAAAAVALIADGDTLATSGFVGIGFPENLAVALERRFVDTATPRGLTLVYAGGQGDGKERGLNHLGREGLVARVIGGHWGLVPALQALAVGNRIEAWNLPQGVISHLFRDIAAGKPGHLSRVGLGTFVDPRLSGGRINASTPEGLVRLMEIDGAEYLFYKAFPVHIAFLRGTTADPAGNVTMEREALTLEALAIAMAAHNSGGIVIVQVERLAENGSLNPRQVKIPGALVDCVVVAERPEYHLQTYATAYSAAYAGEIRVPRAKIVPQPMSARKIVARRAALELRPNTVINLGIGMPEGVAAVADEEHVIDLLTLTAEPGVIGGIPAGGLNFGAAVNTQAILDQPYQFDFYDGGGLDLAVLGLAQADGEGNLNVSRFGSKLAGAGGFINISQNAGKVVFTGTFMAGDGGIAVEDGRLRLLGAPGARKFVAEVEQRTFSGREALARGQPVLYVTERCVFRLHPRGLELVEIAPGIDLERDVLAQMDFTPVIEHDPIVMDAALFADRPMGLRERLLARPLEDRFVYDAAQRTIFIDFEGLRLTTERDIAAVERELGRVLGPLGHKVLGVVNYDHFYLDAQIEDAWAAFVQRVVARYYDKVTRYGTTSFLRAKLGPALAARGMMPHIYDSAEEAQARVRSL